MRLLLFGPPLLQLIIFGYAVNLDVENAAVGWMDQENTVESRELRAAFEGSTHFTVKYNLSGETEIQNLLDHGAVQLIVRIMPGFARNILRGNTAAVQLLVDGTNSNTAAIISNYANQVVAGFTQKMLENGQNSRRMAGTPESGGLIQPAIGRVTAQSRIWFNPDLNSRDYFVPGVVVNIIALVTIMLTSMSIVREKEIGTLEQLMVTPIRPIELMLGKILPFAAVGIFEVAFVTGAALLIFHIPFRGNLLVLLGAAAAFLLTGLGVGLFISTISNTQQQAMMSSFLFFVPAMLLSGFSFPIRNMPVPVQFLTFLNPLRYFMEIVRGVFLKGTGLEFLWSQLVALLVFGAAILGLSALRFHKRLD